MKRANPLVLLYICVIIFLTHSSYAQTLAQPELGFSYACASNVFNEFSIEVISDVGGFASDNKFIIELSDGTGSFDTPIVLKEVSNKNYTLNFTTSISFPTTTFGGHHTIRIRATNPERIGPESKEFSAYYISNTPLILENHKDIFLCDGASATLTLASTQFTSFNWYRNAVYFKTDGASIDVKNDGLYYAEVDFGVCSGGSAISNLIRVTTIDPLAVQIIGDTTVELCSGESYVLKSSITDLTNDYYWYKDGNLITGISNKTIAFDAQGDQMYGVYTLEIVSDVGCESLSEPIEIINANTEFTVSAVTETENLIVFPGETINLKISTTGDTSTIKWYKNDVLLAINSATTIQVSDEAYYYAIVSVVGGACGAEVSSPIFKVYNPDTYFLTLELAGNYNDCISTSVLLQAADIKYGISTGEKFVLDSDLYAMFNYLWFFNGNPLSTDNDSSLEISNSELNGEYQLKIYDTNTNLGISNVVSVTLKLSEVNLLGDATVYLCANDSHTFEANIQKSEYKYTWYKNDEKIEGLPEFSPTYTVNSDVYGDYKVEIENEEGCTSSSDKVSLLSSSVSFNVVANDADSPVILYTGETVAITISTSAISPTITWYKDGVEIPGSNALSLSVSEPGKYRAKVKVVDACGQWVFSDYFNVISPEEFVISLKTDANYEACYSTSVTLGLDKLYVKSIGIESVLVNSEDYHRFSFSWFRNGQELPEESAITLELNSWEDTGDYQIKVTDTQGVTAISSARTIRMQMDEITLFSEAVSTSICEGASTRLYTVEDVSYTYQWYFNDAPLVGTTSFELDVSTPGDYYVKVAKDNCDIDSNSISITLINEDSIKIDPSDALFISEGDSATVSASGGDSYQWQNEQGEVLSDSNTLVVSEEGLYALIVNIGTCEFVKTIEVSFKISTLVPNIVSPNSDGVNDTWILPHGYSYNENVEIIIYNANGIVVFRTTNYQNNWPQGSLVNVPSYTLFYYVIKQEGQVVKKGTITIIK